MRIDGSCQRAAEREDIRRVGSRASSVGRWNPPRTSSLMSGSTRSTSCLDSGSTFASMARQRGSTSSWSRVISSSSSAIWRAPVESNGTCIPDRPIMVSSHAGYRSRLRFTSSRNGPRHISSVSVMMPPIAAEDAPVPSLAPPSTTTTLRPSALSRWAMAQPTIPPPAMVTSQVARTRDSSPPRSARALFSRDTQTHSFLTAAFASRRRYRGGTTPRRAERHRGSICPVHA